MKPDVYVDLGDNPNFSTDIETIPYRIVNTTGESVSVVLIPILERNLGFQFEDKLEKAEFSDSIGFCGAPDGIKTEWESEIYADWFVDFGIGRYRLTFESADSIIEPAVFTLYHER